MTNESLSRLLDRANGAEGPEIIIQRPLTKSVSWARVWLAMPRPDESDSMQHGNKAYLIRNGQQYVGIVLDHGFADLHVFVPPPHRGQHYLSNALRDVILPHLLQDRQEQRITISRNFGQETFQAAERAALAAGFMLLELEEDEENVATLQFTTRQVLSEIKGENTRPTQQRLTQIRQQLAYHASCLHMLSAEVELLLGDKVLPEDIRDLASEVHYLRERIESAAWDLGPPLE